VTWEDLYNCPNCGQPIALANGLKSSPILVIGASPGEDEITKGFAYTGATAGVLRTELGKLGIDMKSLRLTNLWLHEELNQSDQHYEGCFQHGLQECLKEAKDRKAILLLGAAPVKFFCEENVSDVTGLRVQSTYLSAPIIYACLQPAIVFHSTVGGLRLSLTKFAKGVKGLL